jgi:hypothetical protein
MEFDMSRATNSLLAGANSRIDGSAQTWKVIRHSGQGDGGPGNYVEVGAGGTLTGNQQMTVIIESDRAYYFVIEVFDWNGEAIIKNPPQAGRRIPGQSQGDAQSGDGKGRSQEDRDRSHPGTGRPGRVRDNHAAISNAANRTFANRTRGVRLLRNRIATSTN